MHKVPLVTVSLIFPSAGAGHDPPGREGLAQLTAAMLVEGTTLLDGAALTERFEALGSSLTSSADWDAGALSFTVHPSRLDDAVALVRDVVLHPAFPARELARIQEEHRADRLQVMAEPRALADCAFIWECYDGRTRYRRPVDGTTESVGAITRDDVHACWRSAYGTNDMAIVIAGDIDDARARAVTESLTRDAIGGGTAPFTLAAAPRRTSRAISLVDRAGAPQAELRVGHVAVSRAHPAYHELTVMNAVLGGLFSSRINLNLRERHGYTYGAFSGFDWRTGPGPWAVRTAVNTEACAPAVQEILSEIERIRSEPVDQSELALAVDYLVGVFPLRFESTAAVASALAAQSIYGLADDFYDAYRSRIGSVSAEALRRVAREHLRPDDLQIVVVGDADRVRPSLESLGAGPIHGEAAEQIERAP